MQLSPESTTVQKIVFNTWPLRQTLTESSPSGKGLDLNAPGLNEMCGFGKSRKILTLYSDQYARDPEEVKI